jgi:hypothetical protein
MHNISIVVAAMPLAHTLGKFQADRVMDDLVVQKARRDSQHIQWYETTIKKITSSPCQAVGSKSLIFLLAKGYCLQCHGLVSLQAPCGIIDLPQIDREHKGYLPLRTRICEDFDLGDSEIWTPSLWILGPWISGLGMFEPSDIWTSGLPDVSGLLGFWTHMNYSGIGFSPMPELSSRFSALYSDSCPLINT